MGIWDSACSFVSSVCSSVGSAISSAVSTAGALIEKVGSMAVEGLKGACSVLFNIGQALGFIKLDEKPEEMGDKILQAQDHGITLDSCDGDYDAYMEKIRNFKVDPEKSKSFSSNEKLAASAMVVGGKIEQHYGTSIAPLVPIMARLPEFMGNGRLKSMLDSGLSVANIAKYFGSNTKDVFEQRDIEKTLVKHEKSFSPGGDEAKMADMLRSMRQ
jgi:hypothetical protein